MFILFSLLGYLAGSIPFALIIAKIFNLPDPRHEGSKNPGATNVMRVGGPVPGVLTFVGDSLKGAIPIFLARFFYISPEGLSFLLLFIILGHMYPVFTRFRGGKGVATAIGGLFALNLFAGGIFVGLWGIVYLITKTSSLASLSSILALPVLAFCFISGASVPVFVCISALMIYRHKENIKRLYRAEELNFNKETR